MREIWNKQYPSKSTKQNVKVVIKNDAAGENGEINYSWQIFCLNPWTSKNMIVIRENSYKQ